uniref:Uncharacterized protein n=1 Tax=Tanacetum cinerariifolium TaxID=118510 RepID=A0A6L2MNB8_TANCI|nr:hypothetical protein [Tanacetum cinerariifolium]
MLDEEANKKLQAKFDEEERLAREKVKKEERANIPLIKEWDDIQAKIDADHQLAERLQAQEQEEFGIYSIRSSALPTIAPHPTPVVDSKSEPFEDPASSIDFDSNNFKNPSNSEPFEDRVSPIASAALDSDDEPHDSPTTSDYFGESETSPISSAPVAQLGHESHVALYMTLGARIVGELRKTVRPRPSLPLATEAAITRRIVAPSSPSLPPSPSSPLPSPFPSPAHSGPPRKRFHPSPSSSIRPSQKRCMSPPLTAPAPAELPLTPATSSSIPIELLLPSKRFGAMERITTLERDRVIES